MIESDVAKLRLEAAFTKIWHERMDGVPILNAKLSVEAVGVHEWNGHWLSVLITPWFINLMLLPCDTPPSWAALRTGEKMTHRFPAGRFEFIAGDEEGLGRYLMCSLFSPVLEFEDQEAARIAAKASLEALFDATLDPDHVAEEAQKQAKPAQLSRRGLFTGRNGPAEGDAT